MGLIGVFAGLASAGQKIHAPILLVDRFDRAHDPWSLGDLVLQLSVLAVQIEMIPAVAFGGKQHFSRRLIETIEGLAGIDVGVGVLADQKLLLSGFCVDDSDLLRLEAALVVVVDDGLAIGEPIELRAVLKRQFKTGGLNVDSFSRWHSKNDGLGLGKRLSRQGVHHRESLRAQLVRGHELNARKTPGTPGINAVGHELRGIGSPKDRRRLLHLFGSLLDHQAERWKRCGVVPAAHPVLGQSYSLAGRKVAHGKVMVPDHGRPLPVGGQHFVGILGRGRLTCVT